MFSICETLDRLEIARELPRLQPMIEATLDRQARTKLYEYVRAERRMLVDLMLGDMHPTLDQPSFASALFFAGFLDRLCQTLQRDAFLPLELWIKALAADPEFESRSSRLLAVACSMVADAFRNDVPGYPGVGTYLTLVAVELEVTFTNARLLRQGSPRVDTSKLVPADHVADALVSIIRTHSDALYQHALGVSAIAGRLAGALQMTAEQTAFIERCGLLHGIGKIGIAERVLNKPAPLTEREWDAIKRYPAMGASILRTMPALAVLAPVIRAHRERLDGRGYPDGSGAHDIPLQAKVVGVANAFNAMINERPYRSALTVDDALSALQRGAGTEYDPDVVYALLQLVQPGAKKAGLFHQQSLS